jgi:hypothetical protein
MKKFLTLILISLLSLTSCIEIIDDITINSDGSGTFKYTINLSQSRVKVNSILALDSLDGQKVPDINDIKTEIENFRKNLSLQPGISNVKIESNYTNYIFKISCNFSSISNLQSAIVKSVELTTGKKIETLDWISKSEKSFNRDLPSLVTDKINLYGQDIDSFKQGTYTSITRFDRKINTTENDSSIISKNGMAVLLKTDTYTLIYNTQKLNNKILIE